MEMREIITALMVPY